MLDSKTILIVDCSAYGALDLASAIEECDGLVAGPVSTSSEALAILDARQVSAAVIDCEPNDALAIIMRLAGDGVPLVIQTSTAVPQSIALLDGKVSILLKPVDARTVIDALVVEIGKAEGPASRIRLGDGLKQV